MPYLVFLIDWKEEREPREVDGQNLPLPVVDARMGGPKRVVDLLDAGDHLRRVEGYTTGNKQIKNNHNDDYSKIINKIPI